mgnify:FL=1
MKNIRYTTLTILSVIMIVLAAGPAIGATTPGLPTADYNEPSEVRPSVDTEAGTSLPAKIEFNTRGSGGVEKLVVVKRIDRDGDGYASGLQFKMVSDTRPKDPKENGQAGRSTAKLFSVLIGGPFKKIHNFFTKEA